MQRFSCQLGIAVLVAGSWVPAASSSLGAAPSPLGIQRLAQAPSVANCQPPSPGEYLLLVVSKTPEAQAQVKRSLPPNAPAVVCSYLNDIVTRVSGFTSLDTANAWAKYLTESASLPTFVARPPEPVATIPSPVPTVPAPIVPSLSATGQPSPLSVTSPPPVSSPTASVPPPMAMGGNPSYKPQPLGPGYAVLVDYFNQPELASQVQGALGRTVGLVAYGQRPYLLAAYTADQAAANSTLQTLSGRGFWAIVVDSRRVVLLRSMIALSTTNQSLQAPSR